MCIMLVRVGIDSSCGKWHGPCDFNNNFVYVPIPESKRVIAGMEKNYCDLVVPALEKFSRQSGEQVLLKKELMSKKMHLDPDFEHLTYGDTASKGNPLTKLVENDIVMFYASFKETSSKKLVYALMGKLSVKEVIRVSDMKQKDFDQNAHSRRTPNNSSDVIVIGKRRGSGRFKKNYPNWRV